MRDVKAIIADYRSGLSQAAVGKKHGLSQASISGYLRSAGIGKARPAHIVARQHRDGLRETSNKGAEVTIHRIVHPTVAWWLSQHEPAHELQEIELD
jgi:predicted transcriptional regulator